MIRFAVKRQAAILELANTAEKSIPTRVRQFVFKNLNRSPSKFARLKRHEILRLAKAFVATHYTWFRDNRQDGWGGDVVSKTGEEDEIVVSRIIELQAANQQQRLNELTKAPLVRHRILADQPRLMRSLTMNTLLQKTER